MLLAAPFILQGALIVVDEFHFHHRRGLGAWERVGHPLDSISLLACFLWLLLAPDTAQARWLYAGLAIFSCLFITKDEFVHAEKCKAGEHWLHALLFVLHPVVLGVAAFATWWPEQSALGSMIEVQTGLIGIFLVYQLVYWNLYRPAAGPEVAKLPR